MPRGPQGQKRPADVIGNVVHVMRVATGEVAEDENTTTGRVRSGRAGAIARMQRTTPERRKEIAKRAAAVRWK